MTDTMQNNYPCKGCVEKYTNQYNTVDEQWKICGLCIEIAKRKGELVYGLLPRGEIVVGVDVSETGADLSTIQVIDGNGGARLISRGRVN